MAALLNAASVAAADTADDRERREAFERGIEAIKAERWNEAYIIYTKLWAAQRTYDVALSLGQVEFNLKKYRDSAEHHAFAIANMPVREKDRIGERARTMLQRAKQHVGTLDVIVSQQAEVLIDGKPAATTPLSGELYVEPGARSVEVRAPGYESASKAIRINAGERQSLEFSLAAIDEAAPADSSDQTTTSEPLAPPSNPPASRSMMPVYVGLAVTGVGLGTWITFGLQAAAKADDARDYRDRLAPGECTTTSASSACQAAQDKLDAQQRSARIANVGMTVTAVGGLATIGYVLFWPKPSNELASANLKPALSVDGAGATMLLSGSF